MENEIRLRKIGTEKIKYFEKNFDSIYDYYRDVANNMGYSGELKLIKERGKILVYIILEYPHIEDDLNLLE